MFKRFVAGVAAGTVALAGAVALAVPAGATESAHCPTGRWPSAVDGRPEQAQAGMTGAALWHNRTGWHLRVSEEGSDRAVFTGNIAVDGRIISVERRTEGGDIVLAGNPHQQWFRFTNYGAVDGIDFVTRCSSFVKVTLYMNGEKLPTEQIYVGRAGHHPATNAFTIERAA
jgi:hypothetical protein